MSSELAIVVVTATLQRLLAPVVSSMSNPTISVLPLNEARKDKTRNQLNLFLYHTATNAAWRNRDMPHRVKPNETGRPPFPLDLYYLLTVYGQDDKDLRAHEMLGRAVRILHDHPNLTGDDIRATVTNSANNPLIGFDLGASDLAEQIERVHLTWHPLTSDEMYKLWSGFQTPYRLSVAYEASVVLIESQRPVKTPLPVLTRGEKDQGVDAQANMIPPYPALESVTPPNQQSSVQAGDVLKLEGHHLEGTSLTVHFTPMGAGGTTISLQPPTANISDTQVTVPLDSTKPWVAGFYRVTVATTRPGETEARTTNEVPVAFAPQIMGVTTPVARVNGNATVTVTAQPVPLPAQKVSLLLGDQEILVEKRTVSAAPLKFIVKKAKPGKYLIRLRVDGVDSRLVDKSVSPPVFITANQEVTIT